MYKHHIKNSDNVIKIVIDATTKNINIDFEYIFLYSGSFLLKWIIDKFNNVFNKIVANINELTICVKVCEKTYIDAKPLKVTLINMVGLFFYEF
nr:hypothetical protein [Entomoplasma sp. MP1]